MATARAASPRTGSSGYSGTPLAKKLGFKPGQVVAVIGAPTNYRDRLGALPDGVRLVTRAHINADMLHLFFTRRSALEAAIPRVRARIKDDAAVWVSWPKRSSRVETDITEDVIRAIALPTGLVDIKVCAIDDVWSALKLVVRRDRRRTS